MCCVICGCSHNDLPLCCSSIHCHHYKFYISTPLQDHVMKIPCTILFLIPGLCVDFQGAEILTYTKTSVPIIHTVNITLSVTVTVTKDSNMLPTISNPVSLISPNGHCMPHATTSSRHAVGWIQRWTIPGTLVIIKHKNVKKAVLVQQHPDSQAATTREREGIAGYHFTLESFWHVRIKIFLSKYNLLFFI
jgi:hypothetical protein